MWTLRLYKVRFQEGRWLQEESSCVGRVCSPSGVLAECPQRLCVGLICHYLLQPWREAKNSSAEGVELQSLLLAWLPAPGRTGECRHHATASPGDMDPAAIKEGYKAVHPVSPDAQPVGLGAVSSFPLCFWAFVEEQALSINWIEPCILDFTSLMGCSIEKTPDLCILKFFCKDY